MSACGSAAPQPVASFDKKGAQGPDAWVAGPTGPLHPVMPLQAPGSRLRSENKDNTAQFLGECIY